MAYPEPDAPRADSVGCALVVVLVAIAVLFGFVVRECDAQDGTEDRHGINPSSTYAPSGVLLDSSVG